MKLSHCSIGAAALCLSSLAFAPRAWSAELALPRDGWTSWEVAAVDGAPDYCCWSDSRNFRDAARSACQLDARQQSYGSRDHATTDLVRIYARTSGGQIDRFRALSAACSVETATPIHDLGRVAEDESARWLMDLVKQRDAGADKHHRVEEDVLAALAVNAGTLARDGLTGIARNDARTETRKQAVFWMALLRGQEGADITSSIMFNDKNAEVREHAAFSLSQSKAPRVPADLIRLGNTDQESEVRAQAWFWLAQMGVPEAENAILAALRKETDDDVRERAIIALSQLPDARAAKALIAIAEDRSQSRELRKRAVFWLSQSESDAAQSYLEQILTANQ
jgi:HEAT repeat protein